jgi:hypothetical protein
LKVFTKRKVNWTGPEGVREMNAAEHVTMRWLFSKGYFVMSSIKGGSHPYGRNELDLLAIKEAENGGIERRLHVEVSVSPAPIHMNPEKLDAAHDKLLSGKFTSVSPWVHTIFGGRPYERWVVWNNELTSEACEHVKERLRREHQIEVHWFDDVLREYVPTLSF